MATHEIHLTYNHYAQAVTQGSHQERAKKGQIKGQFEGQNQFTMTITPERRKELLLNIISDDGVVIDKFTVENNSETFPNMKEGINESLLTGVVKITIELTHLELQSRFIKKRNDLLNQKSWD